VTPLVASLSRDKSHVVSIVHDSFPPVRVALDRNVSPWLLASVFFYVFPAIVDLSNGAAYGFPSDTIRVVLSAAPSAEPPLRRMPTGSVATAAALTTVFGFGSGHRVLGLRAWPVLRHPACREARWFSLDWEWEWLAETAAKRCSQPAFSS
jgi:hypothetical protein